MRCKTAWNLLPGSRLRFARDPVNSISGRKDVSSLAIQLDGQSISLISLIPLAPCSPLAVLPFAELKAAVMRARRTQGLLASLFAAAGSTGVTAVDAKCVHGEWAGGPWVLIHGLLDGDICFWLWHPWASSADHEGEGEDRVRFLGEGPAELGDVEGVELVVFPGRQTLFVSTPSGSLFTKHILGKPGGRAGDGGWRCHRVFEGRGVATRILRYGPASLLILAGAGRRLALLYYSDADEEGSPGDGGGQLYHLESGCYELPPSACDLERIEGCISPDGSALVALLRSRDAGGGGDVCLLKVALGAGLPSCPAGPPVISRAVSRWSRGGGAWAALYRDDAMAGDRVLLVVLGGAAVERVLRCPVELGAPSDLVLEPDLEVKVLTREGRLAVADALTRRLSWVPPGQSPERAPALEFAHWFNLLEAFPYGDARCLAILAERRRAPLWIDGQLPAGAVALYPPSSWSDLRLLADSVRSPRVLLYLILDTQAHPGASPVACAFCRRLCIGAAEQRLVAACLKLDRGEDALLDLVLARRGGLGLPDRAVRLLRSSPEARAVLCLEDEPRGRIQALVASGLLGDALRLARAESCLDALIDLVLASPCKQAALSLALTRPELDALAGRRHDEPAIRFAVLHALRRKAFAEAVRLHDAAALPFHAAPAWKALGAVIDAVRAHGDPAAVGEHLVPPSGAVPADAEMADAEMGYAPPTRVIVTPTAGPASLCASTPTGDLLHLHLHGHHPRTAPPEHPGTASPSSGSRGSSPPLRSVRPRHVPPLRPSTLAQQQHVESASDSIDDDDDDDDAGDELLMEGVFGQAGVLDLLEEQQQPEPSSEDAEMMDGAWGECAPASAPPSASSDPSSSFVDDGTRYILTSPMVDAQAAEPSPSPLATPSRQHKYNLRPLSPVVYPKEGRASPHRRRHSPPPALLLLPGADETRSQFKRRVRKDLAIPSPGQSPAPRRTALRAGGEASPSKTPRRASPRKATPAKKSTAGTPTRNGKTPPLRLTPITTDRRRRR